MSQNIFFPTSSGTGAVALQKTIYTHYTLTSSYSLAALFHSLAQQACVVNCKLASPLRGSRKASQHQIRSACPKVLHFAEASRRCFSLPHRFSQSERARQSQGNLCSPFG